MVPLLYLLLRCSPHFRPSSDNTLTREARHNHTVAIHIMSHLKYYAYEPFGSRQRQNFHYSQAVRVGDRIECSGQGVSLNPPPFLLAVLQQPLHPGPPNSSLADVGHRGKVVGTRKRSSSRRRSTPRSTSPSSTSSAASRTPAARAGRRSSA